MTLTADFYRRYRLGGGLYSSQDSAPDPVSPNDAPRLSRPSSQSSGQIIASALDTLMGWEEEHSVAARMNREAASLRQSIEDLPLYQHAQLLRKCDDKTLEELLSLSEELAPDSFLGGLNCLSYDLAGRGKTELAASLLGAAHQAATADMGWRNQIGATNLAQLQQNLDILQERGPLGPRLGLLLRGFMRDASDPVNLIGFACGQAVFQSFRLAALTRLTSSGFFTKGLAARALAVTVGVAAEAPALTLSVRGVREILDGSQAQPSSTIFREILSNGINLGFLHLGGFVSQRLFESFHGISPLTLQPTRRVAMAGISQTLFPQVGMLGAIMISRKVEAGFELRPDARFAHLFTDSLAQLAQFHVGGRLFEELQPRSFAAWSQEMEMRSRILTLPRDEATSGMLRPRRKGMAEAFVFPFPATRIQPRPENPLNGIQKMEAAGAGTKPSQGSRQGSNPVIALPVGSIAPTIDFQAVFESSPQPILVINEQGKVVFANRQARGDFSIKYLDFPLTELMQPVGGEQNLFTAPHEDGQPTFWARTVHPLSNNLQIHYYLREQNLGAQTKFDLLLGQFDLLHTQYIHQLTQNQLNEHALYDAANILQILYFRAMALERKLEKEDISAPEAVGLHKLLADLRELRTTLETAVQSFRDRHQQLGATIYQETLSLDAVLKEALQLNGEMRDRNNIELEVNFGDTSGIGENGSLVYAVRELLAHACDTMSKGGKLQVRSYARDGKAVIEVTDTGAGIAPERLPSLFEFAIDRTNIGGTGLGLFSIRRAIERMGGQVEVESTLGVGTTFRLVMPMRLQSRANDAATPTRLGLPESPE